MNISKSESYNLSPDEYLKRFQKPYSIISSNGSADRYQSEIEFLQNDILIMFNQSQESLQFKENAVSLLQDVVGKWMEDVFIEWKTAQDKAKLLVDISFEELKEMGYGLKIFGSFSLKTNSIDADVDMICVVPEFFSREKHFYHMLTEELKKHSNIKEIYAVPDASIPLIKMRINHAYIDLLISRLPISLIRSNPKFVQGEANRTLSFVNDKELHSINGYRTSLYLRKNIKNYPNFQVVLKMIKMWAKSKGIYSQIYGFLGGAALSLMLAKICQLYPNYSPLQLLDRFFFIYANWVWTIPIMIENCNIDEKADGGMIIVTPMEPHMNSVHYISRTACYLTRKYLRLASKMIFDIKKNKKTWKDLVKPLDFFNTYENFVQISVMGEKHEDFIAWKGNIESKIRKFIKLIETQIENQQLIEVHPLPRHFVSKHTQYKYCYKYYIGVRCESNPNLSDYCEIDITPSVRQFLELLEGYQGIDKVPKELNIGFAFVEKREIDAGLVKCWGGEVGKE